MQTICILGAGMFGRAVSGLLNTACLTLLAFGDNDKRLQGTRLSGIPVVSVEEAVALDPALLLISVTDGPRSSQLKSQALECGFCGRFLDLGELSRCFDIRLGMLCQIAGRIREQKLPGSIAELGVYRGDTARLLNALFPEKTLYLFDTFEGFDKRDLKTEKALGYSRAKEGDFSDTSEAAVSGRLPFPEKAIIRKGYFPRTAHGLGTVQYSLVSLDADLYAPSLAGLEYFYPRLCPGGVILLHDCQSGRFRGVGQAVADYEKRCGSLCLIPLCDLHGSAVIIHP